MRKSLFLMVTLTLALASAFPLVAAAKYNEAPMLAEMVKAGKIPAVDKRLPDAPKVMRKVESIGRYGGIIKVLAQSQGFYEDMQLGVSAASLYRVPQEGIGLEPNLAENYQISKDKKQFTVFLRKGAKWSDGHPFTSEDISFFVNDMQNFPGNKVRTWGVTRHILKADVKDDYTVTLAAPAGLGSFVITAAGWDSGRAGIYQPAHYLKKWHEKYNPDAQKLAKEAGKENWWDLMMDKYWWAPQNNMELPSMTPWIYKQKSTVSALYERNPYYWAVDEAGNQLPYVDQIFATIVNSEVYQLKIISGEVDIAYTYTTLANVALYKSNEASGGYTTILWPGVNAASYALSFNLFHKNPEWRKIQNDIRFRQAMNLAIDRDEMNDVLYFGLGVPRQRAPLSSVTFYKPEWESYYATYNPAQANKLLDEVGLGRKDNAGMRLLPSGEPAQIVIEYADANATTGLELISEYFNKVGIKTIIKLEDAGLRDTRIFDSNFDMALHANAPGPNANEQTVFSTTWHWDDMARRQWWKYDFSMQRIIQAEVGAGNPLPPNYMRMTPKDPKAVIEGEKPPDWYMEFLENQAAWHDMDAGSKDYREMGAKIFDTFVKQLWVTGCVGMVPTPVLAKKTLGNVPKPDYIAGQPFAHPLAAHFAEQLYFK